MTSKEGLKQSQSHKLKVAPPAPPVKATSPSSSASTTEDRYAPCKWGSEPSVGSRAQHTANGKGDDPSLVLGKAMVCCGASRSSSPKLLLQQQQQQHNGRPKKLLAIVRALLHVVPAMPPVVPSCRRWLALPTAPHSDGPSLGNKVIGTLFGHRTGHVHFAVQEDPRSEPVLLLELATPTDTLVKEMASGLVRIALECERRHNNKGKLFLEQVWTMYSNGRKRGYAVRRSCSQSDLHILRLVQAISNGAGVLPMEDDGEEGPEGELMYMRARFDRVVGSKDSEAFYMMNPDGMGGPELSIFLLRI